VCSVRGFGMEKGKDYLQNFSLTPFITIVLIITSITTVNDLEIYSIDIEQSFLQDDKLMEEVNDRYFINPSPESPDANKDIVYEVLRPLYGNPSSPRALHKTMDTFFKSEGFDTIGFEESVWKSVGGGKYVEVIHVSGHVDDCLIVCKSKGMMASFKKEILTRFIGTDEGEVTEYLVCDLIRDLSTKSVTIVQKGYSECVLKTFGMWDFKPCATPLDTNVFGEHDETRSRVCKFSVE
jgi:hypothetical protein